MIRKVNTNGMSRAEWLEERRKSIGGSDAAGIIGLSQWSTPYTVWADKTGRLPDKEDNEAMRLGRDLEQYVAERWMEATGKKVRRLNAMLYNSAYPYSHADIDRDVVGENAVLECKTTSTLDLRVFKSGEFPERYYAQCVHYMAVTGAERCYLGVLVFGKGFYPYVLDRDEDEIKALMDAEREFWERYVLTDTQPVADGTEATTDAIAAVYADGGVTGTVDLTERQDLIAEYFQLEEQQKLISERMEEIKNIIKENMQDAESGTCSMYTVTWKQCAGRTSIDEKALMAAHPKIDINKFKKVGKPYRRFLIATKDENKEEK